MSQKTLLNATEIHVALHRLACQLIENHNDFSQTVLIGIQPRGGFLAKRLVRLLQNDYKIKDVQLGLLDITFYRDDFRRSEKPLEANKTAIDFVVEDKVMVELKALTKIEPVHIAQAINYLEAYKLEVGLLINFGSKSLEFRRFAN